MVKRCVTIGCGLHLFLCVFFSVMRDYRDRDLTPKERLSFLLRDLVESEEPQEYVDHNPSILLTLEKIIADPKSDASHVCRALEIAGT